jgi:hypothetical protein
VLGFSLLEGEGLLKMPENPIMEIGVLEFARARGVSEFARFPFERSIRSKQLPKTP